MTNRSHLLVLPSVQSAWHCLFWRLVSKTDNVIHFACLVKQARVDLVSDLFVYYRLGCEPLVCSWGDPQPSPPSSQKPDHSKFIAKLCYTTQDLDLLCKEISCKTISDNSKINIMQQAAAPCLEIIMSVKGKPTRSLLNSSSEVTLINESYYKEHIEHYLVPSSGSYNNSHNLFSLRGVEEGHVPLSKHLCQ